MAASLISLQFDDAHVSHYTIAYPLLAAAGKLGSAYVPTSQVNRSRRMGTSQLTILTGAGWDVCSHGWTGGDFTALSIPELQAQLLKSHDQLVAWGHIDGARHFGPPADRWNRLLTPYAVAAGYQTVRAQSGTLLPAGWTLMLRGCAESKPMAVINGYITEAKTAGNTLLCLVMHRIVKAGCSTAKLDCTETRVSAVLAAVALSGLHTCTMSQLLDGTVP